MRTRIVIALVVLPLMATACTGSDDDLGIVRVERPLPSLSGETIQGGDVTPGDYEGDLMVVNFWATWCGPCREEQPELVRAWSRYEARGVAFVGVNYRDDAAQARSWIDEFDVQYPVIEDQSGGWADDFGFFGLPATYIVDASGTIRYQITVAATEEQLTGLLDELLAPPAAA